nr:retrovirus-related Pol polyprotein from transposon TNT 1-94 [Tanacetum cinerariifolium]
GDKLVSWSSKKQDCTSMSLAEADNAFKPRWENDPGWLRAAPVLLDPCRKSTCFIRDLKGNDLLSGSRETDLYSITLQNTHSPNPICLVAKATSSQAWLWHRCLSYLNFDTINLLSKNDIVVGLPKVKFVKDHLCSFCELGKAKLTSFHTKLTPSSKRRLQLLHIDLCSPMRAASINGKRYVLVIVDDYSRYTWTHFLRSKDETPEVLIDFLRLVQRGLQSQVGMVRTDKGTEILNQTLHAYFAAEGIQHQTSVARTPEQNGIVERRNRTLVKAARTMLSAAKVPLFFWAEAIATAYGENLDKIKEKGDECIFVGYSTESRAYRVFNKRTRVIMESIHVNFDELPLMASDQNSSDPAPECQTMVSDQNSSDPVPECQTMASDQNSSNPAPEYRTVTTSNEMDLLFSPMFDELLNGSSKVVSKSSAVSAVDAPNQRQQYTTPLTNHTTPAPTCQIPTLEPTVISSENINQAETYAENDQVADDEFINIFSTSVQDQGETSSRHVDSSNMHTFYQRFPFEHRWTKDHPLEQVIGNPSQPVRTRRQLESDAEMCMFALITPQAIQSSFLNYNRTDHLPTSILDSHQSQQIQPYIHFKLDNHTFTLTPGLDRTVLQMLPPNPNNTYIQPPSEIQILEFIKTLDYDEDLETKLIFVSNMVATRLHQPWRAILSVLNRCLTGKDSCWDTVRLPILHILWGIVYSANLDFTSLFCVRNMI